MQALQGGNAVRRMLTLDEVLEKVRVARSTLFRMEKAGNFPERVYVSENRIMWFEDEVIAWQVSRPRMKRK